MRRKVVAALLGAALCASPLAACQWAEPGPTDSAPAYRLTDDCPPPPTEVDGLTVDRLNALVANADLPGWQAGDIGATARLTDGRLVWLFGDTVRSDDYSPKIVGNSLLVTSGTCVTQVMARDNGAVIPDAGPETVLWPMSVVVVEPGAIAGGDGVEDALVVLCARTRRGEDGNLDFTFMGTSAAVFSVSPGGAPQLVDVIEVTPDDEDPHQVNWGAAAVVRKHWVYVYGTRTTGRDFGRELYVWRLPVDEPADRAKWEFWDGAEWQPDQDRAAAILPAQGGVSQTLSVHHLDGRYVATSKRDGDLGDFVYTWTSAAPTGPWTPQAGVEAPAGFDTGELKYAPLAHPEIELANGKLLVTISRNTTDFGRLLEDPDVGRPEFAEVERP